jgi:alpha-tubulin suppressor-like RCC1 family protein
MYNKLNRYFENRIKFSLVSGRNTLIVTKDDKVYEFNQYCEHNKNSLIALSVEESDIERFIEIAIEEELCGKNIKKFEISVERTYALTEDGDIYSWNRSKNWKFNPLTTNDQTQYKPQVIQYFKDNNIKVKDVCCGGWHTLVLTTDNLVYGWDHNHKGQIIVISISKFSSISISVFLLLQFYLNFNFENFL